MKKQRVEVQLFSRAGQRNTSVETLGAFPTRHIRTGRPVQTEPLRITPNPTPAVTIVSNPFTEATLLDIIEKMTALDEASNSKSGGWLCEDSIFKVARVNLKHNVTAPALRQMLSDLTQRGVLEYKTEYGLNKFRLAPKPALKSLLTEVDTILDKTGIADAVGILTITMLGWVFYVVGGMV